MPDVHWAMLDGVGLECDRWRERLGGGGGVADRVRFVSGNGDAMAGDQGEVKVVGSCRTEVELMMAV